MKQYVRGGGICGECGGECSYNARRCFVCSGKSSLGAFEKGNTPFNYGAECPEMAGDKNPNWKGGRYEHCGYIHVRKNKKSIPEHRWIAITAYGKDLPDGCIVHHIDCNKKNNNNNNLLICSREYHELIHMRIKAMNECGNPNYRKCSICKKYDHPDNMVFRDRGRRHGRSYHHNKCRRLYRRHGIEYFKKNNNNGL